MCKYSVNTEGGEASVKTNYPALTSAIANDRITKKAVAECISVTFKTLSRKLYEDGSFTIPEAFKIRDTFFPDKTIDELFAPVDDTSTA